MDEQKEQQNEPEGQESLPAMILRATLYAAQQHSNQLRKGHGSIPYVNHVIDVAALLARTGGVEDGAMLQAALLHDTVEDTDSTFEDIERMFGSEVCDLVREMTDDKGLAKEERKRLQVEHAPEMSDRGKQVKIADKISNIRDVVHRPPPDWPLERRRKYVQWGEDVVAGCRGVNEQLEALFDQTVKEAWDILGRE